MTRFLASALAGVLLVASDVQADTATPAGEPMFNRPTAATDAAIRHLLDTYTNSVSTGDRATFESQLLDLAIPFSAVKQGAYSIDKTGLAAVQDYAGFRKAIFDSARKYQQRFSNIRIEQLGNLAKPPLRGAGMRPGLALFPLEDATMPLKVATMRLPTGNDAA